MTEFHIIGLGNLCEFVIKNIDEKQTYGTFSACGKHNRKSMQEFVDYVNQLIKENELLKIALCYTLDDMGSSYHVDLFEGVFNFNFDELMGRAYDIEWEELLKGDGENE